MAQDLTTPDARVSYYSSPTLSIRGPHRRGVLDSLMDFIFLVGVSVYAV